MVVEKPALAEKDRSRSQAVEIRQKVLLAEPNLIIVLLYIVLKKIRTNRASHEGQSDITLGTHALRSQPTD